MTDNDQGQRERSVTSPLRWFARDDPVADLAAEDSFGHRAYTEVLAEAILATEPPFTIGVFGDWGVGKTTITKTHLAEVLKARAKRGSIAYAYFDVWKYEGDSLRRQFLRDVARQLKGARALKRTYDPDKELEDLVVDVREVSERGFGFSRRRLLVAAARGVLTFGLFFGAIRLVDQSGVLATQQELLLALLVGGVSAFAGEIGQVFVVGEREVIRRSVDSPELFESKFRELMDAVTTDRVVVVIDNLDRCTPDRVVEVLTTIKTFLEPSGAKLQPSFVIPCDDAAIRRHLLERGEIEPADADEYLRKFFNATLRINPILAEEIRDYASAQLKGLAINAGLADDARRELTQVISTAFRKNPRRVKQFLNTVTSKLMLIRERESAGIINPKISDELPFLAKLTVIEEEWPAFYAAIRDDPRSFELLSQRAIGVPVELGERLAKADQDERLKAFLRGTRPTVSRNIRAFTRLKLAPVELKLTNFSDYRNALLDGRLEDVGKLIGEVPDANRDPYREAAVTILKEEIGNGYVETALNVVDATIRLGELQSKMVAAEVIEQLYAVQGLRDLLPSLAPFETLRFLELTDSDASPKLIGEYLDLLGRSDLAPLVPPEQLPRWQAEVVRGLIQVQSKLTAFQLATLKELANGPLAKNIQALSALAQAENGPKLFIGPQALEAALTRLEPDGLEVGDDGALIESAAVTIWLRSLDVAEAPTITRFVERATEILSQIPPAEPAPGRRGLLELLVGSRRVLSQAESGPADQLAQQLQTHYPHTPGHIHWQVIAIVSALFPSLSSSWQEQVRAIVQQFAGEDPRDIGQFMASAAADRLETLPGPVRDALFTRLKERFRASANPEEQQGLAGMFITHASVLGWEHVSDLLSQAVDAGNFAAVVQVVQTFESNIREGSPDLLPEIASRLIGRLANVPALEQRPLFDAIALHADVLDTDQRLAIRDHLATLINSEDAATRDTGLGILAEAGRRGLQGEAEKRYVIEQAVLWLMSRADRVDTSMRPLLDRVTQDLPLADETSVNNLINLLKSLLARDQSTRDMASQYLAAMSLPAARRDEIVEELIHWARQETDPNSRRALVRRAFEIGSDRRTRAWKSLEGYLHEMEGGEDAEDRSLAAELLG